MGVSSQPMPKAVAHTIDQQDPDGSNTRNTTRRFLKSGFDAIRQESNAQADIAIERSDLYKSLAEWFVLEGDIKGEGQHFKQKWQKKAAKQSAILNPERIQEIPGINGDLTDHQIKTLRQLKTKVHQQAEAAKQVKVDGFIANMIKRIIKTPELKTEAQRANEQLARKLAREERAVRAKSRRLRAKTRETQKLSRTDVTARLEQKHAGQNKDLHGCSHSSELEDNPSKSANQVPLNYSIKGQRAKTEKLTRTDYAGLAAAAAKIQANIQQSKEAQRQKAQKSETNTNNKTNNKEPAVQDKGNQKSKAGEATKPSIPPVKKGRRRTQVIMTPVVAGNDPKHSATSNKTGLRNTTTTEEPSGSTRLKTDTASAPPSQFIKLGPKTGFQPASTVTDSKASKFKQAG